MRLAWGRGGWTKFQQQKQTMSETTNITSIAIRESHQPMSISDAIQQVQTIQQAMGAIMKEGVHYGKIPGCGDKPTLFQSGAEKLALVFRLHPEYQVTKTDLGRGHREYEVACTLRHRDGSAVGQCSASCSTMESKFRFRSESTGREVPREYWKTRDASLLGGHQFAAKKSEGKWVIVQKVEHDNPADYYNTCLKMATKRAYVGATRSATAASDIFEQDLEEIAEDQPPAVEVQPEEKKPEPKKSPKEDEPKQTPQEQLGNTLVTHGISFDKYAAWGRETGQFDSAPGASDAGSFDEIPTELAARHLRAVKSIIKVLGGVQ